MSNTLLTSTQVTRKALMILHQKLNFVGSINRGYDDSFAKDGAKIGDTLKIRVPNQYTVRSGATLSAQDVTESSVSLQVGTQKGVDVNFTSNDLTLNLDDFSERILDPAMAALAREMTTRNLGMTKPTVGADTDSWGGELNTNLDLIDARLPKVAFSAYLNNSTQSIPISTATKVILNAEESDLGGYFDSTSNYRFTPAVAGYYQFSGRVNFNSLRSTGSEVLLSLYKNGSIYKRGTLLSDPAGSGAAPADYCPTVSALIYLNGSTDYIELFVHQFDNVSVNLYNGMDNSSNYLTGFLAFPA